MLELKSLQEASGAAGADVLGVAPVERFDELPEDRRPTAIFPETRSVVVLGRRIPRGALRGNEEGTNFTNYIFYGNDWLDNRFTSLTTVQVAEWLEDQGWEASPLPNLPPEVPPMGVAVRPGAPEPNVMLDLEDAAVRAGVGDIGFCGVLLTPRFGPRQRVQAILSDAEIEPTPLLAEPVCPGADGCPMVCPAGAVGAAAERVICGKRMAVAQVDQAMCRKCKNGASPNRQHPAGKADRLGAVCIRSCVDCLERAGRVANRFAGAFRKRDPWTLSPEFNPYSS
jgi:epoxyqueuosine reductase QueG